MIARRVGLTPTSRRVSSASGWMAAGDEPEGRGRRHVGRHVLIDRLHRRPSFHRHGDGAVVARRPLDRHASGPQHALRVVARATRSRTVVRPSARSPASRIADFTCADGTGVV